MENIEGGLSCRTRLGSDVCITYRKSQQRLGPHHDEGFAEVSDHLSPQQVEVLSGCGGVHYSHVHTVAVHTLLFAVAQLDARQS